MWIIHSIILESFNKSILLLDQYREILDKFAYELLHKQILREPEIKKILDQFNCKMGRLSTSISPDNEIMNFENSLITQKITASNAEWRDFSQNNFNLRFNIL